MNSRGSLRNLVAGGLKTAMRPHPMHVVENINNGSRGTSPLSSSYFDELRLDIIEGNNKQLWMDVKSGWCHLCQEPIGGSLGIHVGDRDHTNLQALLILHVAYPRIWTGEGLLAHAHNQFPSIAAFATTCTTSFDHLHTPADAFRRAELEAILKYLVGKKIIHFAFENMQSYPFWYSGERMFKTQMVRLVSQYLPPLQAGMLTNLTQKCWGRTNGERMFDALRLGPLLESFGGTVPPTRERKAFFVRVIYWEALSVGVKEDMSAVDHLLLEGFIHRMAFECIFLQVMDYMNRVQKVVHLLGYPTLQDLKSWNLY